MYTEEWLDSLLATPSKALIEDIVKIKGDILLLGAGGKMGPTLCLLVRNACKAANISKRVIAVSRFKDDIAAKLLQDNSIEIISADLLEENTLNKLPDCENIIYMAGRKFGTEGQEYLTWAMNSWLPSRVAERYKNSHIVVFSSGNIYPFVPVCSGGCDENTKPNPVGEYAMSCLARERMFEYASNTFGTKVLIYRLNYAIDLRYGVLHDIAADILNGNPISVSTPVFNCIWQGDANEAAIRSLLHCTSPASKLNVTGPETVSVRYAADKLGALLGKEPVFSGTEDINALLSNSSKAVKLFGYPTYGIEEMVEMQAKWILNGGRSLGKPTHFEQRKGCF
ncbi:MAG: NAD-dependent epimerase/dehydratase [Clostridia bacterium]|nr:NAD-dependent epimerase/dehydratase [Clostridia bacterium]